MIQQCYVILQFHLHTCSCMVLSYTIICSGPTRLLISGATSCKALRSLFQLPCFSIPFTSNCSQACFLEPYSATPFLGYRVDPSKACQLFKIEVFAFKRLLTPFQVLWLRFIKIHGVSGVVSQRFEFLIFSDIF